MMNGIVSLLDEPYDRRVRATWRELAERLELTGIQITRFPHFSYHVAAAYADDVLNALLAEQAAQIEPF